MSEWKMVEETKSAAVIKVLGVGGAGGNAVDHMLQEGIDGAHFICANTDRQALDKIKGSTKLILGENITEGLGAGAKPEKGREAALEDRDRIRELIKGADMVFITAGMGGGTGTGAAPIFAQVAKELNVLTVAVVTKPFELEGEKRMEIAKAGIKELVEEVDSLITIPNQKLLDVLGQDCSMLDAFKQANDVLSGAVRGISDIIMQPGMINVDFADVRTVMSEKGTAMMGTGIGSGPDRARQASEQAVSSKLLEDISLQDAKGVLVNITSGPDITLGELEAVQESIKNFASKEAIIVCGNVIDDKASNDLIVTVIATGLGSSRKSHIPINKKISPLNEKRSLPLSSASREYLENPPKVGKNKEEKLEEATESEEESNYLDIPSFVRTQLD